MCGCGQAAAGAIGPELAQQQATRLNTMASIAVAAQGQGNQRHTTADGPSPQVHTNAIVADRMIDTSVTGTPQLLPGRVVVNPAAWDGEPSALSPVQV